MEYVCYSTDGECFDIDNEYTAIEQKLDEWVDDVTVGSVVTIYRGTVNKVKGSDYLPCVVDDMMDKVTNTVGDVAYKFITQLTNKSDELYELLEGVVDKFLEDNNMQPDFFEVHSIKELTFRIDRIDPMEDDETLLEYTQL